jgi:hypothetical protein
MSNIFDKLRRELSDVEVDVGKIVDWWTVAHEKAHYLEIERDSLLASQQALVKALDDISEGRYGGFYPDLSDICKEALAKLPQERTMTWKR